MTADNNKVHLSKIAAAKIIAHAAKNPLTVVFGLLTGRSSNSTTNVLNVIPLSTGSAFADFPADLMNLDIALEHALHYCKKKSISVNGFYYAPLTESTTPPQWLLFMMSSLHPNHPHMKFILKLNNKPSAVPLPSLFDLYTWSSPETSTYIPNSITIDPEFSEKTIGNIIKSKTYTSLQDFDSHLNNLHQNQAEAIDFLENRKFEQEL